MIATIYPVAASEEGEHTVAVMDMSELGVQEAADLGIFSFRGYHKNNQLLTFIAI